MKKKIVILGATGSIGVSTIEVVKKHIELYEIITLVAFKNGEKLIKLAQENGIKNIILSDEDAGRNLKNIVPEDILFHYGSEAVIDCVQREEIDIVVNAIVGTAGYKPTKYSLKAGKRVALANKETLVAYGEIINDILLKTEGEIIPVDSEHSALFQLLEGRDRKEVKKLILTASGGALRDHLFPEEASLKEVLKHPTWEMGKKITVDSATLANKGLEVIEANRLFGFDAEQIEVLIHPTSVVHSLIELIDGSVLAQLGTPDMKMPIQYALSYPERILSSIDFIDLVRNSPLEFKSPDMNRFPCLKLAFLALETGNTMPCVFNASNEEAVKLFLKGSISFGLISRLIDYSMDKHNPVSADNEDNVEQADRWAREIVNKTAGENRWDS